MIFLPIVERELRVASRRRGTYWYRVLEACIAVAVCAFGVITSDLLLSSARAGQWIFEILSWLGLAYVLLLGVITTCDSLSRERREGTLGLLFLTDLKSYDVVLGKLAASSLSVSYGLLAMLPVLAVPLMLGGVTMVEVARVALVWATGLLFSLSIGLSVSSLCRDERNAAGGAFALLLFLALLLPMVGMVLTMKPGRSAFLQYLSCSSPLYACSMASAKGYRPASFWAAIVTLQVLSWSLLALACQASRRVGGGSARRPGRLRWRERWWRWRRGSSEWQLAFRRVALAVNPVFWLLSRERITRLYPWLFLIAMVAIWLWGFAQERTMIGREAILAVSLLMHVIFKIWVTNSACYGFAEERGAGALELLFSTPLKTSEYLRGPWLAIRRLLVWPVGVAIAAELILLSLSWSRERSNPEGVRFTFTILANIGLLFADGWTLYWLGLLAGLRFQRPQNAAWTTLGCVLVAPWLCVWMTVVLLPGRILLESEWFIIVAALGFSLMFDFVLGLWAWARLRRGLRDIALCGQIGRHEHAVRAPDSR